MLIAVSITMIIRLQQDLCVVYVYRTYLSYGICKDIVVFTTSYLSLIFNFHYGWRIWGGVMFFLLLNNFTDCCEIWTQTRLIYYSYAKTIRTILVTIKWGAKNNPGIFNCNYQHNFWLKI